MRPRSAWPALALSLASLEAACAGSEDRRAELRVEVDSLRALFEQRLVEDTLVRRLADAEGDILIGIRTAFVQDVARWTARAYLDDVELHLRPGVTVEEGDEVEVKIGPIAVNAGDWRVEVTINSVRARLRVDSIALAVADSNSMSALLAVRVSQGRGDADIHFVWDATTLASIVCRDFEMDETFGGVVEPFTYAVRGRYRFEASPEGILAIPAFERPRLRVSPLPTEESWDRARAMLDEQNDIFRCGLALRPDDMMDRLDRLLRTGFEFELPEVLFQPVRLPARIEDRVEVGPRTVDIRNAPVWLDLSPDAIWYGSTLEVEPGVADGAPATGAERAGPDSAPAGPASAPTGPDSAPAARRPVPTPDGDSRR